MTTNKQKTTYVDSNSFGHPFFDAFIKDCQERTENAMTQEHVWESARLTLEAQQKADEFRKKLKNML